MTRHATKRGFVTVTRERSGGIGAFGAPALDNSREPLHLGLQVSRFTFGKGFLADQLTYFNDTPFTIGKVCLGFVLECDRLRKLQLRQFVVKLEQDVTGFNPPPL